MAPHLAARDGPLVQELHQVRPGDVQEVGRLLGRQFRTKRREGHGVPLPHLGQGPHEEPQGRGGEDQLFALGAGLQLQAEPAFLPQVGRELLARFLGEGRIGLGRGDHLVAVCQLGHRFAPSSRPRLSPAYHISAIIAINENGIMTFPEQKRTRQKSPTLASLRPDVLQAGLMKAYVAQVTESELRQFVAEDAVPEDILGQLIREWSLAR